MKFLVIYDISDDGNRNWFSEVLLDMGLKRVQYSCFLGDLSFPEAQLIESFAKGILDVESDSVIIIPLCSSCFDRVKTVVCSKSVFSDQEVLVL